MPPFVTKTSLLTSISVAFFLGFLVAFGVAFLMLSAADVDVEKAPRDLFVFTALRTADVPELSLMITSFPDFREVAGS